MPPPRTWIGASSRWSCLIDVAHDRDHRAARGMVAEVSTWAETPTTLTSRPSSRRQHGRIRLERLLDVAESRRVRDDRLDAGWDASGRANSEMVVTTASTTRGGRGCGSRSGVGVDRRRDGGCGRWRDDPPRVRSSRPAGTSEDAWRWLGARREEERAGRGTGGGARARVRDVVVSSARRRALGRPLRRAGLALEEPCPARRGVLVAAAAPPIASVPVAFAQRRRRSSRRGGERRRVKREGRPSARATERDVGGGERARGDSTRTTTMRSPPPRAPDAAPRSSRDASCGARPRAVASAGP